MSQTSYSREMATGFLGMIADARDNVVESYAADETIEFGYGVCAGAKANSVKLPDTSADVFRGVAVHENNMDTKYVANAMVNTLRRGLVYVYASEAVDVDDDAYVVATTGAFCDTSSGNIGPVGKFRETTSAAGKVLVELNLP